MFDPEPMTSEDLIASMKTVRYFTKLDLCKGYWQVPMNEKDIPKTAFQDGHYEFTTMPFGLVNFGATLVKGIRKFLRGVNNVGTYIDDIIIYTESWQEHVQTLDQVLQLLKRLTQL